MCHQLQSKDYEKLMSLKTFNWIKYSIMAVCLLIIVVSICHGAKIREWHLNDASGDVAVDSSGNSDNLGLGKCTWNTADGYQGSGCCLDLISTSFATTTVAGAGLNGLTAATLRFWMKTTADTENWFWNIRDYDGNNSILQGAIKSGKTAGTGYLNTTWEGTGLNVNVSISTGVWHHVVYTFADVGTERHITTYLNGVQVATGAITSGSLPTDTNPATFFNHLNHTQGFAGGKVDEIRIDNAAWTGAEVVTDYVGVTPSTIELWIDEE